MSSPAPGSRETPLEHPVFRLRRRAELGDPEAQFQLAFRTDVMQNEQQTAEWLRKASDQGHIPARAMLALRFEHGSGVPKDASRALQLYTSAAEAG